MNHQIEMHLQEAIDTVTAWDIPNDEFADAVNAQAKLMAGVPADDYWDSDSDTSIQ